MKHIRTSKPKTCWRILTLSMLPAIFCLYFNSTANRHIHVVSNGYVISHAHPFDKIHSSPHGIHRDRGFPASHKHTTRELWLLSLFSQFLFAVAAPIVLRPLIRIHPTPVRFRFTRPNPVRKYYHVYLYHAPPFSQPQHNREPFF